MNIERILRHKHVLLAALKAYEKRVKKVNSEEADLELDDSDSDDRLAVIEELRDELSGNVGKGLEGTPMGDVVASQVYVADDGQLLTVEALDEMLRTIGVDAPPDAIGEWSLDKRKEVYAYVRAYSEALLNGRDGSDVEEPAFILEAWYTIESTDELLEQALSEEEIEKFIARGPWGVVAPDPSKDEWAIRKTIPYAPDPDSPIIVEHHQKFGQLDRAMLIAANLNAIALGNETREAARQPIASEAVNQLAAPVDETAQSEPAATELESPSTSTADPAAAPPRPALVK